jgi:hypothetical protein
MAAMWINSPSFSAAFQVMCHVLRGTASDYL